MVSEVWSSLLQYMNMKENYVRQIARDIFEKYMHIIHWSKPFHSFSFIYCNRILCHKVEKSIITLCLEKVQEREHLEDQDIKIWMRII
jgi:hypothetical protein